MRKIIPFFIILMLAFAGFNAVYAQTQSVHNKNPAKKKEVAKPVVKDTVAQAQDEPEPEDTVDVSFGKNIVNLRTFTGWVLDDRNKWVSSPNRIPFRNPEYNNKLYYKFDLGNNNIRQINVIEMKIDGMPYLGILIEQYKEVYKNHSDSVFRSYIGADYYLIKAEDFHKLWNDKLKMGKPYEVDLKTYYSGLVGYKDIKKRPEYMSSEINKDLRNRIYTDTTVKTYLQFGFVPVKTPKGSFMRFYYGLAYAHDGEAIRPFDFKVFKEKYYEVNLDLFHKFARPQGLVIAKKTPPKTSAAKPKVSQGKKKPSRKPDDF